MDPHFIKSLSLAVVGVGLCFLVGACHKGQGLRRLPDASADVAPDAGGKRDAAGADGSADLRTVDEPRIADLRTADKPSSVDLGGEAKGEAKGKDAGADASLPDRPDTQEADLPAAGCAGSVHGGYIASDLTFTKACSPYVIESTMDVLEKATLVIEAGTVVLFARTTSIFVYGRIEIRGTASDPVVLDSATARSAADAWSALRFTGTPASPSQVRYARIRNCGWGSEGCVRTIASTANLLTLDHVTISDSASHGFVAAGGGAPKGPSQFTMTNCTFSNIPKDGFAARTHAQEFAGIGSGNDFGGFPIAIDGGWISMNTTWTSPGTDIVVTMGSIDIPGSGTGEPVTLSLGPGVKLLFNRLTRIFLGGYNRLEARGTAEAPVVFSSAAPSPQPGDWSGIDVSVSGGGRGGINLSHAVIEYAGGGIERSGGIILYNTFYDAVITDSVIRQNAGQGIYMSCSAPNLPVLTGTRFESNLSDIKQTGAVVDNVGPGPSGTPACPK